MQHSILHTHQNIRYLNKNIFGRTFAKHKKLPVQKVYCWTLDNIPREERQAIKNYYKTHQKFAAL